MKELITWAAMIWAFLTYTPDFLLKSPGVFLIIVGCFWGSLCGWDWIEMKWPIVQEKWRAWRE